MKHRVTDKRRPWLCGLVMLLASIAVGPLSAHANITEIIDATGDSSGNILDHPARTAVDGSGNVYVTGFTSDNIFKIATPGTCSTGGTPCTCPE